MIEGIRHTGIVVKNLRKTSEFYLSLGSKIQLKAKDILDFIENVLVIKDGNIKLIKMYLTDSNLFKLIKYKFPKETSKKSNIL